MNDVVVGVDPSETAREAAVVAAGLAAAYGANLHVVTSADPSATLCLSIDGDQRETDWFIEAQAFLGRLVPTLPYDKISTAVVTGDPAEALCAEAARLGASTIVVGNRHVRGVGRLLGSIASAVIRKTPCHVLVARTT
jgi:nucleotide-binding universal stress UspA family protein